MIETIFDDAPGRGANVRIGLMTFNHEQQVVAHIGQYTTKARLLTELSNLRFVGGGSFLGKGLEFAAKTVFPNSGNGRPSPQQAAKRWSDAQSDPHLSMRDCIAPAMHLCLSTKRGCTPEVSHAMHGDTPAVTLEGRKA